MSWDKNDMISKQEIQEKVTDVTVQFAEKFGNYLAEKEPELYEEMIKYGIY